MKITLWQHRESVRDAYRRRLGLTTLTTADEKRAVKEASRIVQRLSA